MDSIPNWFTQALTYPIRRRSLTRGDGRLNYFVWGDERDPPIVLVHGGAAHAMWWSFLAPEISRHYYVIAPDLSGHGDSGRRDSYSMSGWADEVMAVVEDAGCQKPPVLVGHSMGGLVAIVAAARYGGDGSARLAGAAIVDSPVRRPDPESERAKDGRTLRNRKVYPTLDEALAHFRLIPEQPCEHRYILDHIARHSLTQTPEGWTWKFDPNCFARTEPIAMRDYLARIRCRIALMRGQFSAIVPPEVGAYMVELLNRNAPLIEIPQAHHHLILDQPLAFIAALRTLLADWDHSLPRPA